MGGDSEVEEVESGGGVVDAVGSPLGADDMVVRERRKKDKIEVIYIPSICRRKRAF